MRRALLGLGALLGPLLLLAPSAAAQESGGAQWNGSALRAPTTSEVGVVRVVAAFNRNPNRDVRISLHSSGATPGGCGLPAPVTSSPRRTGIPYEADLAFDCNGTYTITATAITADDSVLQGSDSAQRSTSVAVAMPAPWVTGVTSAFDGRSITVVWNDARRAAKDLSGYVVERSIGGGAWTPVAALDASATSFVDSSLPTNRGEATYRVASVRPSPVGTKVSAANTGPATPFGSGATNPPGDGTTNPGGDGTTSPGGGDGTTSPGGGDGTTDPGAPPGTTPGPTPSAPAGPTRAGSGGVRVPRLGITGTFLPPLLRPQDIVQTPTTLDTFEEELPYGERELADGEDSDDEMASLFDDGPASRGMVIPVATALVLAVWAFHLRFLARAARPA